MRKNRSAWLWSVAINFAIFMSLSFVSVGGCLSVNEEIVPMEFLVVTEENAADTLSEEPNEATEPEPDPPAPPEPEPPPPAEPDPPPPPDPDPIPPPEPPKPPKPADPPKPKPAEAKKPEEKKPEKPKPVRKPIVKGERVGPVTTGKKDVTKAPTQKALSAEEIAKMLNAGARPGNKNQVPPNDASRYYGIINRAFKESCDRYGLESSPTGREPVLTVAFALDGSVRSISLKSSSGDKTYDGQVLQACRQVRQVGGLPQTFLKAYPSLDLRLSVK